VGGRSFAPFDFQREHAAQKGFIGQRVEPSLLKQVRELFLHMLEMQEFEQVIH
jgi:hypothetical protein